MHELKVYVDVYGRIGVCEKFESIEENAGLNEMLDDLVNEDFHGDRYTDFKPGFYRARFFLETAGDGASYDEECYLQVYDILKPITSGDSKELEK